MFYKVKDVLQIRNLEKLLARTLTQEELEQIDDGLPLVLTLPNLELLVVDVPTYALSDLTGFNCEEIEKRAEVLETQLTEKEFSRLNVSSSTNSERVKKQIFTMNDASDQYFQRIRELSLSSTDETDQAIINLHAQGTTLREIAKQLTVGGNKITKSSVARRLDKYLKSAGVKKIFTKRNAV